MKTIEDLQVLARYEETSQAALKRFEEVRKEVDAQYANFLQHLT